MSIEVSPDANSLATAIADRITKLVAGLQAGWSRNVLFGERVDSIEIKLRRAVH